MTGIVLRVGAFSPDGSVTTPERKRLQNPGHTDDLLMTKASQSCWIQRAGRQCLRSSVLAVVSACGLNLCGRDLHGDLAAEPVAGGQAEVVTAPETAGVIPVRAVLAGE